MEKFSGFPGPKARAILEKRRRFEATSTDDSHVVPERRKGSYVIDIDGYRFLDLHCGASVHTLQHGTLVKKRACAQIAKNLFTENHSTPNPDAIDVAEFLATWSPVKKPSKVFWSNSGTEAVEAAQKACEAYRFHNGEKEKRDKEAYFLNGFAGRSHGSLVGTTSNPKAQRNPFWNKWDEEHTLYLTYPQKGKNHEKLYQELREGRDYFGNRFSLEEVSFLLMELPCQGEGGVIPVDEETLKFLYEKMQKHGIFFVADCVQCGMGRCGTLFGCDAFSWFQPDILTMGKALGGGFAIGATIFRSDLDWRPREHSNTFGGHPVTMVAASAAIEETEQLIKSGSIKRLEQELESRLRELAARFSNFVIQVRGMGAMWALEITTSGARDRIVKIGEEMVNETDCGLLLLGAGNVHTPNHALRIMPPLTITSDELNHAFFLLTEAFCMFEKEMENALYTHFVR